MAQHNELGVLGEKLAAAHLQNKGYDILEQNYTFQKAEVDIIAQHNNMVICVEVKTRNSDFFGDPQEFVTASKIKLLVKAMDAYMTENAIDLECRFDIVAVLKNKNQEVITHYEDAFYHF
ncbi:YraN family protein [Bizionia sediminis]|uniref:UPF0102 protein ACFSQP_07555 n=1 Tax=Bizionia sediminis TaxID=1737064 RepID=A0ABW5KVQ5_9FLAO